MVGQYDFVKDVVVAEANLLVGGKAVRNGDGVLELTGKGYAEAIAIWDSYSGECRLLMVLLSKFLKSDTEVSWER